jgi:hypothetical protein
MTRHPRSACAAALLGAQLAGCAATVTTQSGLNPKGENGIAVREDLSGRFVALIGPRKQDHPPFLDVPRTNFSCLRTLIDRKTGEVAQQLYVTASYDGNHDWDAAHDSAGRPLVFLPISRFQIACTGKDKCSYAEEFAAKFPESELTENAGGFSVTFSDHAGQMQTIAVSAAQVAAQQAALAQYRHTLAAAAAPASSPPAPANPTR